MEMKMFVTYLTIYKGNKLPPFYIGYTKKSNIEKGYNGSVKSKKYKGIWEEEKKKGLLKTIILSEYDKKEDAINREAYLQNFFSVHTNPMYINMATANKKFFPTRKKLSEEHKRKIGQSNSKALKGKKLSEETRKKLALVQKKRWEKWRETNTPKIKEKKSHAKYWLGKNRNESTKNKISESLQGNQCHAKEWIIITPNNEKMNIKGLAQFCRENGLHYKSFLHNIKKGKTYKGYKIK